MKSLIITNFDVARTVTKKSFFSVGPAFSVSMTILTREPVKSPNIAIREYVFDVQDVKQTTDLPTGDTLYEVKLQQVGTSIRKPAKSIFQYADITEISL